MAPLDSGRLVLLAAVAVPTSVNTWTLALPGAVPMAHSYRTTPHSGSAKPLQFASIRVTEPWKSMSAPVPSATLPGAGGVVSTVTPFEAAVDDRPTVLVARTG